MIRPALTVFAVSFGLMAPSVLRGEEAKVATPSEGTAAAIAAILAVSEEGEGNEAASEAWKELAGAGAEALPDVVRAMSDASPLAANWLRSAGDAILDRALEAKAEVGMADLGEALLDPALGARARRLAFEMIERIDPEAGAVLVPGLLNDPAAELRRPAVAQLTEKAAALAKEGRGEAAVLYRQALGAARDPDQVKPITEALEKMGRKVDLQRHFGFVTNWKVAGPFDNSGRKGFFAVYPPEEGVDLGATYEGKAGDVTWGEYVTADPYGLVDLNKPYGMVKEAVGYAYTEFESEVARPVEIRIGCKNAWKLWVNGEYLFGRDEYHRGIKIDQYVVAAQLKPGVNTVLMKLCQNEQTETWTVEWGFQLRVCDEAGTAVLAANRPETPEKSTGDAEGGRRPNRDTP